MKILVVLALVWNMGFFGGEVWAVCPDANDISCANYTNSADRVSDIADRNNPSSANYENEADKASDAATSNRSNSSTPSSA